MSSTSGYFWHIVKYENGVLTTRRDGHRFEDFEIVKDGSGVYANKHLGDHEYDSGGVVDITYDGSIDQLNTLVKAAIEFHENRRWITKESEIREMNMSKDEFIACIEEFKTFCIGAIGEKDTTQAVSFLKESDSKIGVLLNAFFGFIDARYKPVKKQKAASEDTTILEDDAMNLPF